MSAITHIKPKKSIRLYVGRHKAVKTFITQRFVFLRHGVVLPENVQVSRMFIAHKGAAIKPLPPLCLPYPLPIYGICTGHYPHVSD